jgi:hypothetical protein
MAMALELMAEAAAAGWPELHVVEMKDLRLLRGLVLDNGSRPVRVLARPQARRHAMGWKPRSALLGLHRRLRFITRPLP